jgi:uncharacterized membrane protein YjjP (DUF1212 family)
MNLLELPVISSTRRNHGLEHATIHVLSERIPSLRIVGRAQPNGFYLYGNVKTEEIAQAVSEAIRRMRAGERQLAVHPGCGTNLVASGFFSGGLAFLMSVLSGRRARWYERLPNAVMGGMAGVAIARPIGPWLQANVTTSADMHAMRVRHIVRSQSGPMITHFVETDS